MRRVTRIEEIITEGIPQEFLRDTCGLPEDKVRFINDQLRECALSLEGSEGEAPHEVMWVANFFIKQTIRAIFPVLGIKDNQELRKEFLGYVNNGIMVKLQDHLNKRH